MRAAPKDLESERARQVRFHQRSSHFTREHQHSLGLPDYNAPGYSCLSVTDGPKK